MLELQSRVDLQVCCAGSTVLRRFKRPADQIAEEFDVVAEVFCELEGSTGVSMAKSVGVATIEFASVFERVKPDAVLLIGDRYEALGAATAATYTHTPLIHVQGGELSGSLDELARHAITKLAGYHIPATEAARNRLVAMGEPEDRILAVGCPAADIAAQTPVVESGRGLCIYHPDTAIGDDRGYDIRQLLHALASVHLPFDMLWPNIDAGSDIVSKEIRKFRDKHHPDWLKIYTNWSPDEFYQRLAGCRCAVGNSSSFVRDSSWFGTPVVLVGHRQDGREIGPNAVQVGACDFAIAEQIKLQLHAGRYEPDYLYGRPGVSEEAAEAIASRKKFLAIKRWADGNPLCYSR